MIEVKGLYKDFGSLHVLRGVSLNVEQGDIISIIGPSGSGKSTLLRSINLLEKPTFGEICRRPCRRLRGFGCSKSCVPSVRDAVRMIFVVSTAASPAPLSAGIIRPTPFAPLS